MYEEARHAFAKHGVIVQDVSIDIPAMMKQKDDAVSGLTKGIEGLFKKNKVTYIKGWGSFNSPTEIGVAQPDGSSTSVQTKNTIIATGSDVLDLPGVPIDEKKYACSLGGVLLGIQYGSTGGWGGCCWGYFGGCVFVCRGEVVLWNNLVSCCC